MHRRFSQAIGPKPAGFDVHPDREFGFVLDPPAASQSHPSLMPQADPFHLQRFVDAQQSTYDQASSELAAGEKRSHWMWFIFPQIAGLGSSPTAGRFAITNLAEAQAYLAHPDLGPRLRECIRHVNAAQGRSLASIFGYPDDLKFHSSITLFAEAAKAAEAGAPDPLFTDTLTQWFNGRQDPATLARLR